MSKEQGHIWCKVVVAVFLIALFPSIGYSEGSNARRAHPLKIRCDTDMLDSHLARGRNAWARKCGVIQSVAENFYNSQEQYVTFANIVAPYDENADCVQDPVYFGICNVSGCYTPDQRMMFSGNYMPIAVAFQNGTPTVTSFSEKWRLGTFSLDLQEEAIGNFVAGEETRGILVIETDSGLRIKVTEQHPMVDNEGNVLPAQKVEAGRTQLLTVAGPARVKCVESRFYRGPVWNIEPESTRTLANIHIAEDFVTGSVRYQNEWAAVAWRLNLRNTIDASSL